MGVSKGCRNLRNIGFTVFNQSLAVSNSLVWLYLFDLWVFLLVIVAIGWINLFSITSFPLDVLERIPELKKWIPAVPSELLMLENVFIGLVSDFVKVIHIKLTHERGEVPMPEVYRQNFLFELLSVIDDEGDTVWVPTDDFFELLVLNRNDGTSRI